VIDVIVAPCREEAEGIRCVEVRPARIESMRRPKGRVVDADCW